MKDKIEPTVKIMVITTNDKSQDLSFLIKVIISSDKTVEIEIDGKT